VTVGRLIAGLIVFAAVIFVLAPVLRSGEHLATLPHHLAHAVILIGGSALGLALAKPRRQATEQAWWLMPTISATIGAMLLMWPSLYEFTESRPGLHALDHLAIGVVGFVAAYAGERYRVGVGWIVSGVIVLMAITAAGGFGGLIRDSYPQ
jgi:hypothetical protein